jgi:acetolactate synthase I/II/III large subunit
VLIDIPRDVQLETVNFEHWPEIGEREPVPAISTPTWACAGDARLRPASRPVGRWRGGCFRRGGEVLALAERASMPVTSTLMGLTVVPHDHPLNMGMLGMHAQRHTNMAMEACDLILAAGVRFDDRATGKVQEFCPQAKVIHIDIDHSELDKLRPASVAILGDVREVIRALLPGSPRPSGRSGSATSRR